MFSCVTDLLLILSIIHSKPDSSTESEQMRPRDHNYKVTGQSVALCTHNIVLYCYITTTVVAHCLGCVLKRNIHGICFAFLYAFSIAIEYECTHNLLRCRVLPL